MSRGLGWLVLLLVLSGSGARAGDDSAPVLTLRYAQSGQSQAITVRGDGLTLSAYGGDSRLRWTYRLAQSAGSPCEGEAYLTALIQDDDNDGLLNAARGEQARLFASLRWRDGPNSRSAVLALDLSSPGPPRLLWRQDDQTLSGLAELVSAPTTARVRIARSNQDPHHWVLLLGAGLPRAAGGSIPARDGARLYALDARDGRLLWSAAARTRDLANGGTSDQHFTGLTAALPGAIAALDLDNDGYTDRLYVGDWQAGLWRFDLHNSQTAAQLATGAALAQLADPSAPQGRGFIAAPDVSRVAGIAGPQGRPDSLNIAIGSMATGRLPAARQALFVLRDRLGLASQSQAQFDALPVVYDSDLPVLGSDGSGGVAEDAAGFKLLLDGAQVLARGLTSAGLLLFTQVASLQPLTVLNCSGKPLRVSLKVGALDAVSGRSVRDLNHDGHIDTADRAVALPGEQPLRAGLQTAPPGSPDAAACALGASTFTDCPALPPPRRIYWRRNDAD
jgi:hypothetical protein